jgi:autotransporter-associated beta strand protein
MISGARRASLLGCASFATLALFTAPTRAEEQLFKFFVNAGPTGCCSSYVGPGQGPGDTPPPGGITFVTTSSGDGAISEASGTGGGVKGGTVTGVVANDAYDGYGQIGFRGAAPFTGASPTGWSVNFGGLTVNRNVQVTLGAGPGGTTIITAPFANAGVFNAARWVDTFTNNTGAAISGNAGYSNNLGSDSNTKWVGSSSGNNLATTGNRWLTSIQNGVQVTDPVITHVFGNNALAVSGQMIHADGSDKPVWQFPITVAPGQTKIVVLFNVLTADIGYDKTTEATEIALGAQLANLITNNGNPIAADSTPFLFFTGLTRTQLMEVVNYDFVGLTIDKSRPFFIQTDFAVAQPTAIFDGGTLKPTTAMSFNQNFQLNPLGGTIDNSNGVQTFNSVFSGTGPLTLTGTSATILNSTNTYTGATNVNGGTLVVNGSIAASSLTTVNTGGTLAGTGVVGSTTVAGGTFAPGNGTPGSSMTVTGNLAFQSAGIYMVQVNPATSSFVTASGTATLGGATVNAVFASGTYVAKKYTIINAAGVSGSFGAVTNTNLPAGFTTSTSTDATHAYLNLNLFSGPTFPNGLNANQQAVANALSNSFNTAGGIPMVYGALTARGLTIASGELGTSTQQATNQGMNLFVGVLGDPEIAGRGDGIVPEQTPAPQWTDEDERAVAYAENGKRRPKGERDAYAAMYKKALAPATDQTLQRWSVWTAAFGGTQTTDGNPVLGSNTETSRIFGTAVGVDYRFSPFTLAGVALAGGGTNFSIANGLGSGHSDLFQAGVRSCATMWVRPMSLQRWHMAGRMSPPTEP